MSRTSWLSAVSFVSALAATPAVAAELYTIDFPTPPSNSSVSSATPFRRDSTYGLAPSNGTGELIVGGFAGKGYVSAFSRIDCQWGSGFSGAFTANMRSQAETMDFVITGPSGPFVTGTLHARLRANLDKGGGYPGNNGHGAALSVDARVSRLDHADYAVFIGSYYHGNSSSSGSGSLAALTNPQIELPISITGSFPVGQPFLVSLKLDAGGSTYGNVAVSPGFVEADEGGSSGDNTAHGLFLEEVGAQVMALPEGYTLNSTSWGISDNHFNSPLAVEDPAPGTDLRLALAGPNPSSGIARFALSLPQDGQVRVTLFDTAGRLRARLFDGWQSAGTHPITWDGRSDAGAVEPAGLYFVRAENSGRIATRAIVRVR